MIRLGSKKVNAITRAFIRVATERFKHMTRDFTLTENNEELMRRAERIALEETEEEIMNEGIVMGVRVGEQAAAGRP